MRQMQALFEQLLARASSIRASEPIPKRALGRAIQLIQPTAVRPLSRPAHHQLSNAHSASFWVVSLALKQSGGALLTVTRHPDQDRATHQPPHTRSKRVAYVGSATMKPRPPGRPGRGCVDTSGHPIDGADYESIVRSQADSCQGLTCKRL